MPKGSLALVGSGEYLPAMASLEQSLIQDGVKNGKKPPPGGWRLVRGGRPGPQWHRWRSRAVH